jgi:hypothetical protein
MMLLRYDAPFLITLESKLAGLIYAAPLDQYSMAIGRAHAEPPIDWIRISEEDLDLTP